MDASKAKRILVVDDEPDVTELLEYKLEQEDYTVEVLNDPLSFVAKVREFEPDLMILDIMMPELNGLQLCRIARSDPAMKEHPDHLPDGEGRGGRSGQRSRDRGR